MKKSLLFAIALVALVSCGKKVATLTPQTVTIKGELGEYYEVVNKTFPLNDCTFGKMVQVELKRLDKAMPSYYKEFDPVGYSGSSVIGNYGFGIEIFDEDGTKIEGWRADEGGACYSHDDLKNLWELEPGESNIIRWSTYHLSEYEGKSLTFKVSSYVSAADYSEPEPTARQSKSPQIDRMLSDLDSKLKRLESLDEFSDAYDDLEDEIDDLLDQLDDLEYSMTSAQEKLFDKLDDLFMDL